MAITDIYQDKIMGGLDGDPDPYNFNQLFNQSYTDPVGVPGMDERAINYIDAPVRLMMRQDNPYVGPIDQFRSQGNPDQSLVNRAKNTIGKGLNLGKDIVGKGLDLGKQGILTALSFATGIPAGIVGMLPERDYRQKALEDFYGNVQNGTIQSGLMAGYNPVSGGLFGTDTNYGLGRAIDKRMETIKNTLSKKKSSVLEQRLKDLEALKAREAAALEAAKAKQAADLEAQRRGRRPGSGGDGGGTADSGGPTGGYSYDSGGRQGFGYGL